MAVRRKAPGDELDDPTGRIPPPEPPAPQAPFQYNTNPPLNWKNGPLKKDDQRSESGPRDDIDRGGAMATPVRPRVPTPMSGSTFQGGTEQGGMGAGPQGVTPFQPMGGPTSLRMATPSGGGMFGSMGGLQGGGLGLPFDPTSDAQSDPITTLIQQLKMRG